MYIGIISTERGNHLCWFDEETKEIQEHTYDGSAEVTIGYANNINEAEKFCDHVFTFEEHQKENNK
jgi:hypothetical protein